MAWLAADEHTGAGVDAEATVGEPIQHRDLELSPLLGGGERAGRQRQAIVHHCGRVVDERIVVERVPHNRPELLAKTGFSGVDPECLVQAFAVAAEHLRDRVAATGAATQRSSSGDDGVFRQDIGNGSLAT